MNMLIRAFAGAALLGMPVAALADTVEEKNVLSGKAKLDPASGYMFIQAPMRTFGLFLRVPDDETRAAHQKDWEEAFAKAKKKYESAIKKWESDVQIAKQTKSKPPERPVEPTRETFRIDPIELRDQVGFGPMFIYNKSETKFTYLNAVKPGTYVYYGPMMLMPGAAPAGMCYCMGTVQFEVKPGVITDLGNFLIAAPKAAPPYDYATIEAMRRAEERKAKGKDDAALALELAFGVPETLKALPSVQADFRASGKINNFYNLPISRIQPIAGVLDYRRDTVIDLRTGADVPNPKIVTQVRIKR